MNVIGKKNFENHLPDENRAEPDKIAQEAEEIEFAKKLPVEDANGSGRREIPIINELGELKQEIEQLQELTTSCFKRNKAEKQSCSDKLQQLSNTIERITSEKNSLRDEMSLNDESVRANNKEIDDLKAKNNNSVEKINELENIFNIFKDGHAKTLQELYDLKNEKQKVDDQLQERKNDVRNNINFRKIKKYENSMAGLLKKSKELSDKITILNKNGEKNIESQKQIDEKIQENQAEIIRLKEENEFIEKENKKIKSSLKIKNSELETARKTLGYCNSKKDELNTRIIEQKKTIQLFEDIINSAVSMIQKMKLKIKSSLQSKRLKNAQILK